MTTESASRTARLVARLPRSRSWRLVGGLAGWAAIAIALLIPATGSGYWIGLGTVVLINVILALGLGIMLGYAGLLNLGYAAFAGVGGYGAAIAMVRLGLPWIVGLLIGVGFAILFAVITAVPTLRLRKIYLALVTLAFGELFVLLVFNFPEITGGSIGLAGIPRPALLGISFRDSQLYYYFVLALAIAATFFVVRLEWSRFGRALKYLREEPIAAEASGIDTSRTRILAFVAGAVLAAVAGVLLASHLGALTHRTFAFPLTLAILTMVVVGGAANWRGMVAGAVVFTLLPEVLRDLSSLRLLLFGVALSVVVLLRPQGFLPPPSRSMFRQDPAPRPVPPPADPDQRTSDVLLEVQRATRDFGGLRAVNDVSLEIRRGELVSIIGPNGAGKTTLVDMIAGVTAMTSGTVRYGDVDITGWRPNRRARAGIHRTFQKIRLFPELTVLENVATGRQIYTRSNLVTSILQTPGQRREESENLEAAASWLAFVGDDLFARRHELVRHLPYGLQKRVEIARALAAEPQLLILDEPAAGLNSAEKDALIELIRAVRQRGTTVILIEHDMRMVMRISDRIIVLDDGNKIVEGDEATVRSNRRVVEAYLGVEG